MRLLPLDIDAATARSGRELFPGNIQVRYLCIRGRVFLRGKTAAPQDARDVHHRRNPHRHKKVVASAHALGDVLAFDRTGVDGALGILGVYVP